MFKIVDTRTGKVVRWIVDTNPEGKNAHAMLMSLRKKLRVADRNSLQLREIEA